MKMILPESIPVCTLLQLPRDIQIKLRLPNRLIRNWQVLQLERQICLRMDAYKPHEPLENEWRCAYNNYIKYFDEHKEWFRENIPCELFKWYKYDWFNHQDIQGNIVIEYDPSPADYK